MQDRPVVEWTGQLTSEIDRDDLRSALVATQESAAVQVLLEACLPTEEDEVGTLFVFFVLFFYGSCWTDIFSFQEIPGQKWSLREVRSLICSYLHQVFIADIALAKLVHFQVSIAISARFFSSFFFLLRTQFFRR